MTGVKFGSIWTSRCRDIDAEAGTHALMQAVRKGVASERYVLDSTKRMEKWQVQQAIQTMHDA
jgi:hypothetical protein